MGIEDWTNFRLGDFCTKIGSGATPRGGSNVYLDKGKIALIRSQNIHNDGFRREGLVYISQDQADQLNNVEVKKGDVLLNITGDSVARCCQVDPNILPARVNQHVAIIRPDGVHLDAKFIRYYMISYQIQKKLLSWAAAGGTRNALTKAVIEGLQVIAPKEIKEQQAIACILGALDDKIELNRRMNETLEGMARALFKSWFVDFEPVRYKAAGQQPPGLAPHIADLFPDGFEESELGEIPKGWLLKPIGEMVQVLGGGTPSTEEPLYWEGGIHPFCTPKDMASLSSPVLIETERHLTDEGLQKISSGQLPAGTVLLSSRAPIGYLAIAEIPVSVNQGIIAMICDKGLPNLYVLHWTQLNIKRIIANAGGTTFLEISKQNFRPIKILFPPKSILQNFIKIAGYLHQRLVENVRENRILAQIRDTILPKLISGELRVPDAERIVGRCI